MKQFLKDMFSSSACASFGRAATAVTVLVGCGCLIYVTLHNHRLPDPLELGALAAWMTAPYSINKLTAIFQPPSSNP
jgi:hypothetical protein